MSFRNCLLAIAIGSVCAGLGQAEENTGNTHEEGNQVRKTHNDIVIPFPVELVESKATTEAHQRREDEARKREIEDLIAQQGMNAATQSIERATWDMRNYTLYSTIFGAFGSLLLIVTLYFTYRANRAASLAITVTLEIGKKQLRAYINVDSVEAEIKDECIILVVRLKNFGSTPAHGVTQSCMSIFAPFPWVDGPEIEEPLPGPGPACGPNSDFAAVVRIRNFQALSYEDAWGAVRSGKSGFWVQGMVRYKDVFGDEHHTRYRYVLGGRLADQSNILHPHGEQNTAS